MHRRLGYVDGLRALAALYVVVCHTIFTIWPAGGETGISVPLTTPFAYGHQAVAAFIVLSGFSLMLPVARNPNRPLHSAWQFYWRRARRIVPPYYLAMALSLALIWLAIGQPTSTIWHLSLVVTKWTIIAHLLLFQDFLSISERGSINYVFWSIAMECQIYLIFPLLAAVWRRYHPAFAAALLLVTSLMLWALLIPTWVGHLNDSGIYGFAPQFVGLFALGMLAATLTVSPTPLWQACARWHLWEVVVVGGALLFPWALSFRLTTVPADLVTGVICVGLLMASANAYHGNLIRCALQWRPLVWIGGISYSLYLIHAPLIQLIWQYALYPLGLSDTVAYLALLLLGVPVIVLAAWGFWWLCERPFLNVTPAVSFTTQHLQTAQASSLSAAETTSLWPGASEV